jgi:hypothetical protein
MAVTFDVSQLDTATPSFVQVAPVASVPTHVSIAFFSSVLCAGWNAVQDSTKRTHRVSNSNILRKCDENKRLVLF